MVVPSVNKRGENVPFPDKNKMLSYRRKTTLQGALVLAKSRSYLVPFRRYRSLLFEFWTLCIFEPPLEVLGITYDVHLGLIGKHAVDLLLVLIELFLLGVMAKMLRAKTDKRNISAKSLDLTSLYPTASTLTNDHLAILRHYVCSQCKIMQHLGINFGAIWRFLLGFFI